MDHLPLSDIPILVSTINFLLRDEIFDNLSRPLRIRHRKRMHLTFALQAGEGSAEVKQLRLRVCKEEI